MSMRAENTLIRRLATFLLDAFPCVPNIDNKNAMGLKISSRSVGPLCVCVFFFFLLFPLFFYSENYGTNKLLNREKL